MEFRSIFGANWEFSLNRKLTSIDFERKFNFLKTHKNSYTGPLGTTDSEYGVHHQEIWSFGPFLTKAGNFR
jgi:hypothetical protein